MGLLKSFIQGRSEGSAENPQYPLTSTVLLDLLNKGSRTKAGINVTTENAHSVSTFYRCVALISSAVGGLPLHTFKKDTKVRTHHDFIEDPHPDATPFEVWEYSTWSLLVRGNSYMYKARNGLGQVQELWPIQPHRVRVGRVDPDPSNPSGKFFLIRTKDGEEIPYTSDDIFHIPGLGFDGLVGFSIVELARQAIALGMAAEQFAATFFGNGSLMDGILTTDQKLQPHEANEVKRNWKEKVAGLDKAHEIAVLHAGTKFQPITLSQRDSQFLETRKFQVTDMARWFGVPPHMVQDVEKSTSWGTGIEQQGIGFVTYTLGTWTTRTQQRVTKHLLPKTEYSEFIPAALLRGDTKSRYQAYWMGRQGGWLSANDILRMENMPEIEGGDEYLVPSNLMPTSELPFDKPKENEDED